VKHHITGVSLSLPADKTASVESETELDLIIAGIPNIRIGFEPIHPISEIFTSLTHCGRVTDDALAISSSSRQ
jgi:hypothetical protein